MSSACGQHFKKISLLSQEYSEERFKKEFKLFVNTKLNQNQ